MNKIKYPSLNILYYLTVITILFIFLFPCKSSAKAPTISIIEPSRESIVSGTVEIKATAKDNQSVTQVEFFINESEPSLCVDTIPEMVDEWSCEWNTLVDYADGYYVISAKATDTTGKTATHSVRVLVKNQPGNIAPTADIYYNSDGYKYYFYPYDCYDPDGFIEEYEYIILQEINGNYEEIDTYRWNKDCPLPGSSSGFCLFFVCPYVCYEFPEPGSGFSENYRVEMKVWDNEGQESNTDEELITISSSAEYEYMYIDKITYTRKLFKSSTTVYLLVAVSSDSNTNGTNDPDDLRVSGALVKISFKKDTDVLPDGIFGTPESQIDLEKTTDRNGEALFVIRNLTLGDYRAEAWDLIDQDPNRNLQYESNLDNLNPRDITNWH